MKTYTYFLGKRLNMTTQVRRRSLVVMIYAGLAALMTTLWFLDHWRSISIPILFIASYCGQSLLGGYGYQIGGLLNPFESNELHSRYAKNPQSLWSRWCNFAFPWIAFERIYSNDERELQRRDHAHYLAYRYLGLVIFLAWMSSYFKDRNKSLLELIPSLPMFLDQLMYGSLMTCIILFLTLPQAILLWTEPDMEEPQ